MTHFVSNKIREKSRQNTENKQTFELTGKIAINENLPREIEIENFPVKFKLLFFFLRKLSYVEM